MNGTEKSGDATLQHGTDAGPAPGDPNKGDGDPSDEPRWYSRGYLPHFESASVVQHVTVHLADSLPKSVVERLDEALKSLPVEKQDSERRKRVEAWMEAGHGSCALGEPIIADMVQKSLLAFDGQRYRLLAWVVMPNHIHVLFQPLNGWTMAKIVASWKSFTGRRISVFLTRSRAGVQTDSPKKRIWHREYWDRYIRDERHFNQVMTYIHLNPVKAKLVARAEDWPWSSAGVPGMATLQRGGPKRHDSGETR